MRIDRRDGLSEVFASDQGNQFGFGMLQHQFGDADAAITRSPDHFDSNHKSLSFR